MPLVTSKEMILEAQKGNYAVGAFNIENMEMVMAVIEAAQEMHSPAILQTTPSTVRYGGLSLYYASVKAAAERASVPIALHLDHGSSFELAIQALREGYTSIMIDGSRLSFQENATLSRRVVDACHSCNIPVEAELGCVGGKEDDLSVDGGGLTSPDQAAEFVERTGIDYLAVAIGTSHGVYQKTPCIRVDRLKEIKKEISVPLVLHGTSGVDDETVRACIKEGISKVNYATDLRIAYSEGIKRTLNEDQSVIDPKIYGKMGRELVKRYVEGKMWVCKSSGRAF